MAAEAEAAKVRPRKKVRRYIVGFSFENMVYNF
jgi:hypothetical protein